MEKILKVKKYLKEKYLENIDERLTQAFARYIQLGSSYKRIIYKKDEPRCVCIKLKVKFIVSNGFSLPEIYAELITVFYKNNLTQLIVSAFYVTPEIMDVYNNNEKFRGIIASIKYIK